MSTIATVLTFFAAMYGPAGMPPEVVNRLNAEVRRVSVTNLGARGRDIQVTSYAELALTWRQAAVQSEEIFGVNDSPPETNIL